MLAAIFFAALPLLAQATLQVTQPTGAGWIGNTSVTVSWTWAETDPSFTIELANPTIQSGLLAQGPIAVANNVVPNTNSKTFELPVLPPGSNYQIMLVAVGDINTVYASSPAFDISSNPSSTTLTGSNTAAIPTSSGAVSASKTASNSKSSSVSSSKSSASSASSTGSSSTGTSTSEIRTFISVTPVGSSSAPSSSPTSSQSGAGSIMASGWAPSVAVGAMIIGALIAV